MNDSRNQSSQDGQGTVEFALAMPLVFLVIVAILEMGFAMNAYVNVMYAARDGARSGAIYAFQADCADNDSNREAGTGCTSPYSDNIRASVTHALANLHSTPPNFDATSDVSVTYDDSVGSDLAARKGQRLNVRVTYRHYWLTGVLRNSFVTFVGSAQEQIE